MKVFISIDMEGVAGVVDWDQCRIGTSRYAEGCRLLLGETNAAVLGALDGGATSVTVCDAHGAMANLPPDEIAGSASYVSGRRRSDYMMAGLDSSFDVVFFVGYHGSLPLPSVLSHTYNPSVVGDARIGGVRAGESGINALVAAAHNVPIGLVTGDQYVGPEALPFCPEIRAVEVKTSLGRESAINLHPSSAAALIRDAAASVVGSASLAVPVVLGDLEVDVFTADMALAAATVRGVERSGERTVTIATADPVAAYRSFVAMLAATRGLTTG